MEVLKSYEALEHENASLRHALHVNMEKVISLQEHVISLQAQVIGLVGEKQRAENSYNEAVRVISDLQQDLERSKLIAAPAADFVPLPPLEKPTPYLSMSVETLQELSSALRTLKSSK